MGLHEQQRGPGVPDVPNVIVVAASRPPASYRNRGKFWGDPDTGAVAFSTGEEWVIAAISGAPANASYLVLAANGSLTAERVLVFGTGFATADGGGGANFAVAFTPGDFTAVTPAADDYVVISDVSDGGTAKKALAGNIAAGFGAAAELTIASGAVTKTGGYHKIDTEADAASDDLDTINGGVEGDLLILRAENSSRDVVVKDGTGNLKLAGDMTLDHVEDRIVLQYDGTNWCELSRSNNSA
jgi:hypothetical protein